MGNLQRNCPHCHTKSVSFSSYGEINKPNQQKYPIFTTAFYCGICYGGYIAEILKTDGDSPHSIKGNIEDVSYLHIENEYPSPQDISAPDYLPENINTFYIQAADSLRVGNLDASSMMSRKALEVAVKKLDGKGKSLYLKIENLAQEGKITEELKDWAHAIRLDGNEAAHEDEPVTPEFAKEILSFAEMFLMYTFTMPERIALRRKESE